MRPGWERWVAMRLAVAWLALAVGTAAAATACEKTVRWHEDPPFSMRRADGEIVGINVELVREALRRMDCSARMLEMPWARALAELEAGRLDVLPGTLRLPERERFAYFSKPGPQTRVLLFVPARTPIERDAAQLAELRGSGFRLGAQLGVSYGPDYDLLMRDPSFARDVRQVAARRSLWLMLDAGRLDGVLANELTARLELQQLGLLERVRSTAMVLPHKDAAVAFSRKTVDEDFVRRYDEARATMQKDGSVAAILRRYGAL